MEDTNDFIDIVTVDNESFNYNPIINKDDIVPKNKHKKTPSKKYRELNKIAAKKYREKKKNETKQKIDSLHNTINSLQIENNLLKNCIEKFKIQNSFLNKIIKKKIQNPFKK